MQAAPFSVARCLMRHMPAMGCYSAAMLRRHDPVASCSSWYADLPNTLDLHQGLASLEEHVIPAHKRIWAWQAEISEGGSQQGQNPLSPYYEGAYEDDEPGDSLHSTNGSQQAPAPSHAPTNRWRASLPHIPSFHLHWAGGRKAAGVTDRHAEEQQQQQAELAQQLRAAPAEQTGTEDSGVATLPERSPSHAAAGFAAFAPFRDVQAAGDGGFLRGVSPMTMRHTSAWILLEWG